MGIGSYFIKFPGQRDAIVFQVIWKVVDQSYPTFLFYFVFSKSSWASRFSGNFDMTLLIA